MNLELIHVRIRQLLAVFVTEMEAASVQHDTYANHLAETILVPLLRVVYELPNLRNLNTEKKNHAVIDLADDTARVTIQVTGQNDSTKIKKTINGFISKKLYKRYDRLIVYILTRKKDYQVDFSALTKGHISFDKKRDIKDFRDVMEEVDNFDIDKSREVLRILQENFDYLSPNSPSNSILSLRYENSLQYQTIASDMNADIDPLSIEMLQFEQTIPRRNIAFVGRKELLQEIRLATNDTNVLVILGISGSGKTDLLRELYSSFEKDNYAVFWYTFTFLTSLDDLLLSLAMFVDRYSNHPSQLSQLILQRKLPTQSLINLLIRELNKGQYYLFLDAIDKSHTDNNIKEFLLLLPSKLDIGKSKFFISSQSVPTFYTPADVEQNHVREFSLDGLSQDEVIEFFKYHGYDKVSELTDLFPSHSTTLPMVLVLIQSMLSKGNSDLDLPTIIETAEDRTIESIFEQVYKHLSSEERQVLSLASCFSYPISQHRLVQIQQYISNVLNINITLRNLHNSLLVQRIEPDYVLVHDIIKILALKYVDDVQQLANKIAEFLSNIEDAQQEDLLHAILLFIQIKEFDTASRLVVELGDGLIKYVPSIASIFFITLTEDKLSRENWLQLQLMKGKYQRYWNEPFKAETTFLDALNLASELGDKDTASSAMLLLGTVYHFTDTAKAKKYYFDSMAIEKKRNDIISQSDILTNLASLHIQEKQYKKAQEMLEKALTIKKESNLPEWRLITIYGNLGYLYFEQGNYSKANEYTLLAREIAEKNELPDDVVRTDYNLGVHQAKQGQIDKAIDYYNKSLELAEKHNFWEYRKRPNKALAEIYFEADDYENAIKHFRQLAEVNHEVKDYVDEAIAYLNIGSALSEQDKSDEAVVYYERGLDLFEHLADNDELVDIFLEQLVALAVVSQNVATRICNALKFVKSRLANDSTSYALAKVYNALGVIYLYLNKKRIGIACLCQEINLLDSLALYEHKVTQQVNLSAHFEKIGEISKGIVSATQVVESAFDLPQLKAIAHFNRGNGYFTLKLFDKAENDFLTAMKLSDESEIKFLASVRHNLGMLYSRQNEPEKAITLLTSSLQEAKRDKDIDSIISTSNNLGLAYLNNEQYEEAISQFEQGIKLSQEHYLKYDEANTSISLGNLYSNREQYDKALDHYENALKLAMEVEDDDLIEGSVLSVAYAHWRLGKFDEFEDEFNKVGQRTADMNHFLNLIEFFKLGGQIELSRDNFEEAAKQFSQAFLIIFAQGMQELADFDAIGVKAIPKIFNDIFKTIKIICDWVDYTVQDKAIQNAITFYRNLHKEISEEMNGKIKWVLPYIEPLDDYLTELPNEPSAYYVAQRWTDIDIEDDV